MPVNRFYRTCPNCDAVNTGDDPGYMPDVCEDCGFDLSALEVFEFEDGGIDWDTKPGGADFV